MRPRFAIVALVALGQGVVACDALLGDLRDQGAEGGSAPHIDASPHRDGRVLGVDASMNDATHPAKDAAQDASVRADAVVRSDAGTRDVLAHVDVPVPPVCEEGAPCSVGGMCCSNVCIDPQSDVANCAQCGTTCDACKAGRCIVTLATQAPILSLAISDTDVFWTDLSQSVSKVAKSGGPIVRVGGIFTHPTHITVAGGIVAWTDEGVSSSMGLVAVAPTSGISAQTVFTKLATPYAIAVVDGGLYWTSYGSDGEVVSGPTSGGSWQGRFLVAFGSAITSYGPWIYYTGGVGPDGGIYAWNTTTMSGASTLAFGQPTPAGGIATDGVNVYWSSAGDAGAAAAILSVSVNGGQAVTLASGQAGAGPVATDSVNVYWINTDAVVRIGLTGTALPVTLVSGMSTPHGIAVDDASVYFTNDASVMKITPK